MKILKVLLFVILIFPLSLKAGQQNSTQNAQTNQSDSDSMILKHHFEITLRPADNELKVTDTITLPDNGQSAFTFHLNSLFHLRYKNRPIHPINTSEGVSSYHLAVDDSRQVVLKYTGRPESTPDCAWLKQSCVLLNENGVFLDGNSHWYPDITGARHRFRMDITLPEKWVSLSQGRQTDKGWQEDNPQRALYLLAGAFEVYESQPDPDKPKAMVYLQKPDPKLAGRYLQATHQYLEQYSRLLGEYPYAKFATVESFWETGWGMPSFTLLGPAVMRLPFILHTSFPHEILHNWWGNGVYVDSRDGNWSEGLTAYLSDHYNKASESERIAYRRDALQRYKAFTAAGGDFPLRDFRGRHDRTTQAIGYDKALMVFHMLRRQLGKKQFFSGLKAFYQKYRFQFADFTELQQALIGNSSDETDMTFRQWLEQRGAPRLEVADYKVERKLGQQGTEPVADNALNVQLTIKQTQRSGEYFSFDIPIKVQDENGHFNHQTLRMDQGKQQYTLALKASARRLLIDPYFDLLRIPDKYEVPATLNTLFNRQAKTFVLNSKAESSVETGTEAAWHQLFTAFSHSADNMSLQADSKVAQEAEILVLQANGALLMQKLAEHLRMLYDAEADAYMFDGVKYASDRHMLALTLYNGKQQLILLSASVPESIKLLTRKLPHYGRYSYVLFESATGRNVAKGQWPVTSSPMVLPLSESPE